MKGRVGIGKIPPIEKESLEVGDRSDHWRPAIGARIGEDGLDNAKGGWAQTSPPLAFWSFPISGSGFLESRPIGLAAWRARRRRRSEVGDDS